MPSKPAAARLRQISSWIDAGLDLGVSELAEKFGVTTETVRRDLKLLEKDGSIRRVFGGAVPVGQDLPPLEERETQGAAAKRAIARMVAPFVSADQCIYLSSGSTCLAVARELAAGPRLQIMTHMPKVAEILGAPGRHEVTLVGGLYNYSDGIATGLSVLETVENRNFDLSIIGAYGLEEDFGAVDNVEYNFHLKRRLKARSRRCIFLATAEKFGRAGTFRTLPLAELDILVTDRAPDTADLSRLRRAEVEVLWPEKTGASKPEQRAQGG